MPRGWRRRRDWRSCWWWWPVRCWATRSRTPSIPPAALGRRQLPEHGRVQLVLAVERQLATRDAVGVQPLRDPGDHLRRDELIGPSVHERQPRGPQPIRHGLERKIQIGWKLAAP